MRFWFINRRAYVGFAGLMLMVFALHGFKAKAELPENATRVLGAPMRLGHHHFRDLVESQVEQPLVHPNPAML